MLGHISFLGCARINRRRHLRIRPRRATLGQKLLLLPRRDQQTLEPIQLLLRPRRRIRHRREGNAIVEFREDSLDVLDRQVGQFLFGDEAAEELGLVVEYLARDLVEWPLPALEADLAGRTD
jgi:hypothetical protein